MTYSDDSSSTLKTAANKYGFLKRGGVIGASLTLIAGLGLVAATPAAAASYTVGAGVEAFGVIATGANGGSTMNFDPSVPIAGGTGAVVTTVVDSSFSPGDTIDTTIGTGGAGGSDWTKSGGGGGRTLVTNTTTATDLVIAGAGGGAADTGTGGNAGANSDGSGSNGGSGTNRNGRGGAGGVGGAAGTGNTGTGSAGGAVNGGDGIVDMFGGGENGGKGGVGSTGGIVGFTYAGGGGGAGYGGGGGGGAQSGGEGGGGSGGGGGGGSYSISASRSFEQADGNSGATSGNNGDAVVTWLSRSVVTPVLGSSGEMNVTWTASTPSTASSHLGSITYELYRDGTKIETTSGTSFTDTPGTGTHVYKVRSIAPLNNKAAAEVGDIATMGAPVTSPNIVPPNPPTPSVKKPRKPTKVSVTGGPTSAKRVVRWKAPSTDKGARPVVYYRVKVNLERCSTLIVNKKLGKKARSYTVKRSLLLKNFTCKTSARGEVKRKAARFVVKIEAFNSAGGGPISATRFLVRR